MQLLRKTDKIATFFLLFTLYQPGFLYAQESASRTLNCQTDFTAALDGFDFLTSNRLVYTLPETTKINTVHITRLPIFDLENPDEDNWLYRLANRLHIQTKENTVDQLLFFEPGDTYDERIRQETGRFLRQQNYFQAASVLPISLCNDQLDIEVVTRDTWSLVPGISFDRSGGENSYAFSIRESNFLGRGKLLAIAKEKTIDRESDELLYEDSNFLSSRHTVRLGMADTDDGFSQFADLGLPFYSLDSRRSWLLNMVNEQRVDTLYFRGEEVNEIAHRLKAVFMQYGISKGLQQGYSRRYLVGYQYHEQSFTATADLPPPAAFPEDRKLSYPFLAYESVEDRFATALNLNQIYRTEDLHLGRSLQHKLGFAAEAFGSDQDRLVLTGAYRNTLLYADGLLWTHELNWEGYWNIDSGSGEDIEISYESRFFKHWSDLHSSFIRVEGTFTRNLNTSEQLTLGGLNGARAYDNHIQVGDRRLVINLEERAYTNIHLFNLVRVGGAVFMDIGSAWSPSQDNGTANDILADAGFGLRFTASKGASRQVAHLDFAFPLANTNDPAVDSFQIAFNVKSDF